MENRDINDTKKEIEDIENISGKANKNLKDINKNFKSMFHREKGTHKPTFNKFWLIMGIVVVLSIFYVIFNGEYKPTKEQYQPEIEEASEYEKNNGNQKAQLTHSQKTKKQEISDEDKRVLLIKSYELAITKKEALSLLEQKLRIVQNNVAIAKENLKAETFASINPTLYEELLNKIDTDSANKIKNYEDAIRFLKGEIRLDANLADTNNPLEYRKPVGSQQARTLEERYDNELMDTINSYPIVNQNEQSLGEGQVNNSYVIEDNIFTTQARQNSAQKEEDEYEEDEEDEYE